MNRKKLAILFLALLPIYLVPVFSMHICIGQEHHHGNCDGNMHHGSEKDEEQDLPGLKFKKAKHIQCFQLQKEKNPCIQCKIDNPIQQLALIAAVFHLNPNNQNTNYKQEYRTPHNKEPPPEPYRVRPPPFTCT